MVELPDNWTGKLSQNSSLLTGEGIVLDIGTGDGRFVYQCARQNPRKFFIGIDANPRPLEKISEKVHRKPAKGGLPNVLFLQASVEDLPNELDGVANEIHVHFPWGSLLRSLVIGDQSVLTNLRRICTSGALLEVVIGLDEAKDRSELDRLDISEFGTDYVNSVLVPLYRCAGFEITESGDCPPSQWPNLETSWAKRLAVNPRRPLTYIIAQAVPLVGLLTET